MSRVKIVDRLILTLYSLCLAVISFFVIIIPFNIKGFANINDGFNLVSSMEKNYIYSFVGLIFLIVSIRFLLSGIIGNKVKENDSFLSMKNEYGEIIIYSNTIVGLAQNVVDKFSSIKNIKTSVNLESGQINIQMNGEVMPETSIPDITKELQSKVKEYVETATGAKVGEITVKINNVSAPTRIVK